MKLTTKQLAVLNHIVVDGQEWVDKTLSNSKFDESTVLAKIARHQKAYEDAKASGSYQTRKVRQDETDAAGEQKRVDSVAAKKEANMQKELAMDARIAAEVAKQLAG